MEIKYELDTEKASKAAVVIATAHALSCISLATDSPPLAIANAIVTIIIVAILYCPRPAPKHTI
jgi:hypothetical protein